MEDRYEGRPLVGLLECYVLHAIGMLHEEQQERLRNMEQHLSRAFGREGNWLEILTKQMEFPDTLPGKIEAIWKRFLADAHARGESVIPEEFARIFVDQNFPDIEPNIKSR